MVKSRGNKRGSGRITLTLRRVRVTSACKYMRTVPSTVSAQRIRLFFTNSLVEIQVWGDVELCHWVRSARLHNKLICRHNIDYVYTDVHR